MTSLVDPNLLYRFFFYGWLFRDASRGSMWERSAAWNHNREQCHWLATYLRRWGAITVLLFLLGALCEAGMAGHVAASCFNFVAILTVPYHAVTAVCWWFLHTGWAGSAR
jgi:hypothetical protein